MKVSIKRFDTELPLPAYKTAGAVAMDCAAREDVSILPQTTGYVPLNVAIQPPSGHFVLLAPRSSLHKRGLWMANSVGIGDEDFSGDEDEYTAALYNTTSEAVEVKKGDRLVQLLVLPFERVEWEEVDTLTVPNRGGFGTTGV